MLPILRSRRSNSGRDNAHHDDAVEQSGRRAVLTRGAAMAGSAVVDTDVSNTADSFPPNDLPPRSVSTNDAAAAAAYILNLNGIVDDNFVADRNGLPKLRMPNRGAFRWRDPRPDTHATECMKGCADPKRIKIQSTAEGKDVTPRTSGPLDEMLAQ